MGGDAFFIFFSKQKEVEVARMSFMNAGGTKEALSSLIERIHSRSQHLCKLLGTKEIFGIRKESQSHRICLEHQYGRRFIVLEHQYGRRDVM